jgi:hypothetical protein
MGKAKLTLETTVDVRTDYLRGLNTAELSEKYKISDELVRKILNSDDRIALRLAEENIQRIMNKETDAIVQIKDSVLKFISLAVESATASENPHLFLKDVSIAMEKIDRIQRLNQSRPTDIKEERSFISTLDVNSALEQLKTPEDQLNFLRRQLNPNHYDNTTGDNSTVRRTAEVVVEQAS